MRLPNVMNDDRNVGFPLIRNARGGPSADGDNLLVETLTAEGQAVRFAVPLDEVKHFVSFLLVSVGKIAAFQKERDQQRYGSLDASHSTPCRPIPATSIAIGEPEDDEGYLVMTVGQAELLFSMPISAFEPVARSMLLASVQPKGNASKRSCAPKPGTAMS
jgi:hypothetical protein